MIKPPLHPREAERLDALSRTGLLDSLPEQAYDDLVRIAAAICDTPIALMSLVDWDRQWFKAAVGMAQGSETPREVALCAHAILGEDILLIEDATADPRTWGNPLVLGDFKLRFFAGAPMVTREGLPLGTLCVIDHHPRSLDAEQLEALAALARQAVRLIELTEARRREAHALDDLEAFFAHAPALMCIVDREGRAERVSPMWDEVLGLDSGTLVGRSVLEWIHPEDAAAAAAAMGAGLRGEDRNGFMHRARRPDGGERVLRWFMRPSQDGTRLFGVAQDVTEQHEAEQLKDRIISTVSHELRTPMTSIHGALRLLDSGHLGELPEPTRELLGMASRNTERLLRLLDDLLDLERLREGRLELRREQVYVHELLQRAVDELTGVAALNAVKLACLPPQGLRVVGDPDRLVQVLVNLGSNAIKASPIGGVVRYSAREVEADRVSIEVCDQGPGVPLDKREQIFERFAQLAAGSSGPSGGTGLGLAICQAILHEHGGRIQVDDAPGGGARFRFELAQPSEQPGSASGPTWVTIIT